MYSRCTVAAPVKTRRPSQRLSRTAGRCVPMLGTGTGRRASLGHTPLHRSPSSPGTPRHRKIVLGVFRGRSRAESRGAGALCRFILCQRECDRSPGVSAAPSAISRASSSGARPFAQECGETVVRRRLGELARESVSPQRGVGVAFEHGCARTIAAQRDDERHVLDRNRDVGVVRLARGMDPDRLARRRERAGKIVDRDEIAREVMEQRRAVPLSAPDRIAGSISRTMRDRSLRLTARVFDLGEIALPQSARRGRFRARGALCGAAQTCAPPSRDHHETGSSSARASSNCMRR